MPEDPHDDLRERLRREIINRTQGPERTTVAQMARESGVSANVLHKLKRNDTKSTDFLNAVKLATYFGWSEISARGFSEKEKEAFTRMLPDDSPGETVGPSTGSLHAADRPDVTTFEINSQYRQGVDTVTVRATLDKNGIDIFIARLREIQKNMSE